MNVPVVVVVSQLSGIVHPLQTNNLQVLGLLGGALAQPTVDEGSQMWTNPCLHYK